MVFLDTVWVVSLPPGVRSLRCVLLLVAYAWLSYQRRGGGGWEMGEEKEERTSDSFAKR